MAAAKSIFRGLRFWILLFAAVLLLGPYFGLNIFDLFSRRFDSTAAKISDGGEIRSMPSDSGQRAPDSSAPSEKKSESSQSLTDIEELLKK